MLQWTLSDKYLSECLLSILLGIYLGVELLGLMVILFSFFEELPNCFQLHHFTFLPAMFGDSSFLTLLSMFAVFHFSEYSRCDVLFHWCFDLHFSDN